MRIRPGAVGAGFPLDPRNWTYRLPAPERWDWARLGAEQRAVLAQTLWRAERGLCGDGEACRRVIPWAGGLASSRDALHGKEQPSEGS